MKKLRAAIVGCGGIHHSHTAALAQMEAVEIAAMCDVVPERAAASAKAFDCIAFADFESLLAFDEFDVLHICTPHYLHADMAIAAMERGKHVLCEKPMSISYEDALRVAETAERTGMHYGVCFQNRYNESTAFLRELLQSGSLGKVKGARAIVTWDRDENYYASGAWRGKIATEGGGVLINQAIHTLDLMQWLVGKPVLDVKASVSTKRLAHCIEVEDTADLLLDFGEGVRGTFYATLCYADNSSIFLELLCENGRVTMDENIRVCRSGEADVCYDLRHPTGEKAYWGTGHAALIGDFYASIAEDRPFPIDARAASVSIDILDRVYRDARG